MDIDTAPPPPPPTDTTTDADLLGLVETLDALTDRVVVAARTTTTDAAAAAAAEGSEGLRAAGGLAGAVDRLTAAVVFLLGAAEHADVVATEGLTAAAWLRAIAGRTGGDAGMLLAAAERLGDMPATAAWFANGALSWGTVRGIVAATRNLTADQRRWIDQSLAEDRERIARLDADGVVAAVGRLADLARPDLARDRAQRAFDRRFLALQPGLDGTGRLYGELDAETTAAALQAFDTTPTPNYHHDDYHDHDGDEDGEGSDDEWGRRQSNHDIFRDLCQQRLTRHTPRDASTADPNADAADPARDDAAADTDEPAAADDAADAADAAAGPHAERNPAGDREPVAELYARHGGAPSAARPSMLIVADINTLTGDDPLGSATAQLLWRTTRTPVELTPEAVQRLACDATLRVVLVDGAVPLGVGAAHPKVSATMRAALTVRDGGCRFTGCQQPAERCDAHHLLPVDEGGPTVLHNLALLCSAHHHAVHEGGWRATLHADASMTFTRRGTTVTSLPRAHQHITPTTPPPPGRPTRTTAADPTPAEPSGDAATDHRATPSHGASPPRSGSPPPLLPF